MSHHDASPSARLSVPWSTISERDGALEPRADVGGKVDRTRKQLLVAGLAFRHQLGQVGDVDWEVEHKVAVGVTEEDPVGVATLDGSNVASVVVKVTGNGPLV